MTQHDRELGQRSVEWTLANTDQRAKDFMRALPFDLRFDVGDSAVHLVHGSPRKVNEYLFEDKPARLYERLARAEEADLLVFGHTHKPWIREHGGVLFVNCGSVGKPKDGDPRAAFAVLTPTDQGVRATIERAALRRPRRRPRGRRCRPARGVRRQARRRRLTQTAEMSDGLQLNDPQTLYRRWEESQWSPYEIDLATDQQQWPALSADQKGLIHFVLSSLMVAEERITTKFSGLVGAHGTRGGSDLPRDPAGRRGPPHAVLRPLPRRGGRRPGRNRRRMSSAPAPRSQTRSATSSTLPSSKRTSNSSKRPATWPPRSAS